MKKRIVLVLIISFVLSAIGSPSFPDSLQVYLKNAGYAFSGNDFPKALRLYHEALRFDSLNLNALKNLGVLYSMKKAHKTSLDYLLKVHHLDTADAAIYNSLGVTYSNLGDTANALKSYRKAVAREGDNIDFLRNLSSLLVSMQKYSDAKVYLEQAMKYDTTDAEVYFLLGETIAFSADYSKGENYFDRAVSLSPKNIQYLYFQGVAKDKLAKLDEAVKIYRRIIKLQPNHFDARQRLGADYLTMNKFPEALEQFEESVKINPESNEARIFLGATYMYNNMPEKSREVYNYLVRHNAEAAEKMLQLIQPQKE